MAIHAATILGLLRDIQRRFETAVLLVHHARKSGATLPGQALRGSSELHARSDSNLYLRRRDRQILLTDADAPLSQRRNFPAGPNHFCARPGMP